MESFKIFLKYVKVEKKNYILALIGSVFRFLIPLALPLVLKYVFDGILINENMTNQQKYDYLYWIIGIITFAFVFVRGPMEYMRQYFVYKANNNIIKELRKDAFYKIHELDADYYEKNTTGEIGVKFFDDIERVRNFLSAVFVNIWVEMMVLGVVIAIMMSMHWQLTLLSIILVSLQFVIGYYFSKKIQISLAEMMEYRSKLSGYIFERIQGAFTAIIFSTKRRERSIFKEKLDEYEKLTDKQVHLNAQILTIVNNLSDYTPFLIVIIASGLVVNETLTIGALIAFYVYVDRMRGPIASLVKVFPTLVEGMVSIERVQTFINTKTSIVEKENSKRIGELKGKIEYRNVNFGYLNENETINNLSITLEKGKVYAFAGETGGGKTTILKLLLRTYEIKSGQILIDGTDLKDISLESLYEQIGVVTQDVFLYSDSIYENIFMAKEGATQEDVYNAAKKAYANEFIEKMPNGYQTKIGERGIKLSGGQKQRIALARVFLKDPSIYLFDEATSSLDNESENKIQKTIDKIEKDKTIIMIAHRLSTIKKANKIFMLKKGEVVESGDHEELMKNRGYYYSLHQVEQNKGK